MTTNIIEATIDDGSLATLGDAEQALLLLLASQDARNVQARAQEDADMDAETILAQADEALVLG